MATWPDGRSNQQGQGAVVGEVGGGSRQGNGSIQASEMVRIGETGSVEGAISAPRLVMVVGTPLQGGADMSPSGWDNRACVYSVPITLALGLPL